MKSKLDQINSLILSITNKTKSDINILINHMQKRYSFNDDFCIIINRRNNSSHWLRPFLTAYFATLSELVEIESCKDFCNAVELFNISTYQSNLSLDNKIDSERIKKNHVIYSLLNYDKALNLVKFSSNELISNKKKDDAIQELIECNTKTYLGQYIDLNELHIDHILDYSNFDVFFKVYLKRCELITNTIPVSCKIGLIISGIDNEDESQLIVEAIKIFGVLLQIVNDISDCMSIHGSKVNNLKYSDLMEGKLTLPLYLFLNSNNIYSKGEIDKFSNSDFDELFRNFFEDEEKMVFISNILSVKWKNFVELIKKSSFDLTPLGAYLFSFIFRNNFTPRKIRYL